MPQKTREALSVAGFLLPRICDSIAFSARRIGRRNAGTRLILSIYDRSGAPGFASKMPLTDTATKNTKPGDKPIKLFDRGGLFLLVTPAGQRYWLLKYLVMGKRKPPALPEARMEAVSKSLSSRKADQSIWKSSSVGTT